MVTEYGKFLRKLRIDESEILKTMAEKLGVSSAFLSAVENGKKKIPKDWDDKIIELYQLDNAKSHELLHARYQTQEQIEIELKELNQKQQETAFAFARSIERFDTRDLSQLMAFFNKETEDLNAQ